jgi:hypothetical protein
MEEKKCALGCNIVCRYLIWFYSVFEMSAVMVEIGIHYSFIFAFETDIYLCPNKFYILSLVP